MIAFKTLAAILVGLAIGYVLHPVPVPLSEIEHSRYAQPNFTNPLVHLGGMLSWVYVSWFFIGPLAGLARQSSPQPEQPADDLAFAQGLLSLAALIGFFVALAWGSLEISHVFVG